MRILIQEQQKRAVISITGIFIFSMVITASAVVWAGGREQARKTPSPDSTPSAEEIKRQADPTYGTILKKRYTKKLPFTGVVGAEKETKLAAKTSGRISLLRSSAGDTVLAGTLIAQVSGEELLAQLTMAQHSLQTAEKQADVTDSLLNAQVAGAETHVQTSTAALQVVLAERSSFAATSAKQLESAQKSVNAAKAAYDIAPDAERDVYKAQYEKAQKEYELLQESINARKKALDAQVAVAERQVDQAKQGKTTAEQSRSHALEAVAGQRQYAADNVALAQIAVDNTKVTAPYSGIIVAKHAEVGDIVGAGQPVVTIANTEYRIKISVPETEIASVELGQTADVKFDGSPQNYVSTVTRIYPSVDPSTRTFIVELTPVSNPTNIKYGQTVRVELYQNEAELFFTHRDFVIPSYDGPYIILDSGRQTFVTTGIEDGELIEISYPGIKGGVALQKGDAR